MALSRLFPSLLIFYTAVGMTSAGAKLSLNVVHDVNFTCEVAGFGGRMMTLLKLEIVKKNVQGGDVVLADVYHDGIRNRLRALSKIHPFHEVSGNFDFMRKWSSWLKLAVFRFDPSEDGDYACRIYYQDHPADTVASFVEAILPVNTTREFGTLLESEHRAGFTLWLQRSVQAVCEYEMEEKSHPHLPATVSFLENNATVLATWEKDGGRFELENRSPRLSVQPPRMEKDRRIVFEARVFDISCAKPWECTCLCQQEVIGSDTSLIFSSRQELPQPCRDVISDTATLQEHTSLATSSTPKGIKDTGVKYAPRGSDDAPLHHFTVGLFVSIAVAVVVLSLIGLILYRLKKSKRACFKTRQHDDDAASEAKEPLYGHLGSRPAAEDVELNKDMDQMSVTSLGYDKSSVSGSVGALGLKIGEKKEEEECHSHET